MKVMGHEMIMPRFSYILDFASQILDLVNFHVFFLQILDMQFFSSVIVFEESMQQSIHIHEKIHWLKD